MSEYIISVSAEVIERAKSGETIRITPKLQEIVRCRDCKHSTGDGTCCWHFAYDELDCYNEWISQPADVEPDGFCKWGERRDA